MPILTREEQFREEKKGGVPALCRLESFVEYGFFGI